MHIGISKCTATSAPSSSRSLCRQASFDILHDSRIFFIHDKDDGQATKHHFYLTAGGGDLVRCQRHGHIDILVANFGLFWNMRKTECALIQRTAFTPSCSQEQGRCVFLKRHGSWSIVSTGNGNSKNGSPVDWQQQLLSQKADMFFLCTYPDKASV